MSRIAASARKVREFAPQTKSVNLPTLSRTLQQILEAGPQAEDFLIQRMLDELENYYINFPTELLSFEALLWSYQAEAMVWYHGSYILLCKSTTTNISHRASDKGHRWRRRFGQPHFQ